MSTNVLERVQRVIDRLQRRSHPSYSRIDQNAVAVTCTDECGLAALPGAPDGSRSPASPSAAKPSNRGWSSLQRRRRATSGRQLSLSDDDDDDDDLDYIINCPSMERLVSMTSSSPPTYPVSPSRSDSGTCDVCGCGNVGGWHRERSSTTSFTSKPTSNDQYPSVFNGGDSLSRRFRDRRKLKQTASTRSSFDASIKRSSSVLSDSCRSYGGYNGGGHSTHSTPASPVPGNTSTSPRRTAVRSPIVGSRRHGLPNVSPTSSPNDAECTQTPPPFRLRRVVDGYTSCPASPKIAYNSTASSSSCGGSPGNEVQTSRHQTPSMTARWDHTVCSVPVGYGTGSNTVANVGGSSSPSRLRIGSSGSLISASGVGGLSTNKPLRLRSASLVDKRVPGNSDGVGKDTRNDCPTQQTTARFQGQHYGYDDDDTDSCTAAASVTSCQQQPSRLSVNCSVASAVDGDSFRSRDHAEMVLRHMAAMYAARQLCDVVLVSGEHRVPAHKLVLGAASDYFADLFSADCATASTTTTTSSDCEATLEAKTSPTELQLPAEIDPAILDDVIAYVYTGRLVLRRHSIEVVLSLATRWRLDEVVRACCCYLGDNIRPSTCIGLLNFAAINDCSALYAASYQYLVDNFYSIVTTPVTDFCHQLSAEHLATLLSRDDLNVVDERTVYDAVVTWIRHDVNQRRRHAVKLLAHVRLALLTPQFLTDHVTNDRLLMDDRRCQEMVLEALKYHLLPERRPFLHNPQTRPRNSTIGRLYAVGGANIMRSACIGDLMAVETYDPRTDKWMTVTSLSSSVKSQPIATAMTPSAVGRLQYAVAVTGCGKLYVVGGRDGLKTLNCVDSFDPHSGCWSTEPSLGTPRHGLGVSILEGPMYALGGHDGWSFLNSVERWDPDTHRWSYVSPMSTARSTLGVVAVGSKLMAIGGRDGSCCLELVERYSPVSDSWSSCASLNRRRAGVAVAECGGFVYAVGGHDCVGPGTSVGADQRDRTGSSSAAAAAAVGSSSAQIVLLDCVERYDPRTDCWTFIAPISSPRDAIGACSLGDRLYVVGGCDGSQYTAAVEFYDTVNNEWKKAAPMSTPRAGPCVAARPVDDIWRSLSTSSSDKTQ